MERLDGRGTFGAGGGEAGVGRVRIRDGPVAIDRQPGVQRVVVALGRGEVGLR